MMGDWDTRHVSRKQGGANVRHHIAVGVHYRLTELIRSSAGAAKRIDFLRARRTFIIYEIIYAACWGVGLPFHRDAKIRMRHN